MTEQFEQALRRYADVAVQVGAAVRAGQRVVVLADLNAAPLVREIARSAYQAGARLVDVWWGDEQVTLARYQYAPRDSFEEYPTWRSEALPRLLDEGAALISVSSTDPDLLRDQPPELLSTAQRVSAQQMRPVSDRVGRGTMNWAIVAAPSPGWAARVFPDAPAAERVPRLWQAIFAACRIDQADPVAAWQSHLADLATRRDHLNARRYSALRYTAPGTDLTVGLADGHLWVSGSSVSERGIEFVPNMPTEEVFTMPHRERVDGVVRASKPLNMGGVLIEDFSLTFAGGRVVRASAGRGEEVLRQLVATDEGAARLGEVALVPTSSPIARSGLLYFNTLFDENAACHIALGQALRFTIENGSTISDEDLGAAGGNLSAIHVDFMIGSAEMDIDGIGPDGQAEPVMRAGDWAF